MGRAASNNTSQATDAFAELFGNRRGAARLEEGAPAPMFVGGADDGPIVLLEDAVRGKGTVNAVKGLRLATDTTLTWSKREVYDRVKEGQPVLVGVRRPREGEDWVQYLVSCGWQAKVVQAQPEGIIDVVVQIPADKVQSLRQDLGLLGAKILPRNI